MSSGSRLEKKPCGALPGKVLFASGTRQQNEAQGRPLDRPRLQRSSYALINYSLTHPKVVFTPNLPSSADHRETANCHEIGVTSAAAWVEKFSPPGFPNLLPSPRRNLPPNPARNFCSLRAKHTRASEPAVLRLSQPAAPPYSEIVQWLRAME